MGTTVAPLAGMAGWVAFADASRMLGITRRAVALRVQTFGLPVCRVGRSHLVRLSDLIATYGPEGHRVASLAKGGSPVAE